MTQHTQPSRLLTLETGPHPGDLLNVSEAARHLGTPVRFVRRLVAERRIRFYKVGRYVRIDRHDLDTFITAGCIEPSTDAGHAPSTGWRLQ